MEEDDDEDYQLVIPVVSDLPPGRPLLFLPDGSALYQMPRQIGFGGY